MLQNPNFPGIRPDPLGSLQHSLDPLADGEEARCPCQEHHRPLSALRASSFGPSRLHASTGLRV